MFPAPDGDERLLQYVLDSVRRQRASQAPGEPWRVPFEYRSQCRMIAPADGGDQSLIIHICLLCCGREPVGSYYGSDCAVSYRSGGRTGREVVDWE